MIYTVIIQVTITVILLFLTSLVTVLLLSGIHKLDYSKNFWYNQVKNITREVIVVTKKEYFITIIDILDSNFDEEDIGEYVEFLQHEVETREGKVNRERGRRLEARKDDLLRDEIKQVVTHSAEPLTIEEIIDRLPHQKDVTHNKVTYRANALAKLGFIFKAIATCDGKRKVIYGRDPFEIHDGLIELRERQSGGKPLYL